MYAWVSSWAFGSVDESISRLSSQVQAASGASPQAVMT
jgi:hypothetical protein